jgi:O-antigen/teichoic acid export membrane protein
MHLAAAPRNLTRTVLRGVGFAGGGYLLSQTITFATYLALARLTTPGEFGKFAAGSIVIGVGTLFAESGMLAALIHRRDRLAEAANTALVATVLAGFGMGVLALALSPVIGFLFHSREIALVAAAMSGYLVLRQMTVVPDALLQRRFSFIRRGIVEPAAVVAFGLTAVVACAEGSGVWGLVLGTYASVALQVLLSWSLVGWRPNLRLVSLRMWGELVQFGRHVVAGEFVRRSTAEISTVLIGRFLGAAALDRSRPSWIRRHMFFSQHSRASPMMRAGSHGDFYELSAGCAFSHFPPASSSWPWARPLSSLSSVSGGKPPVMRSWPCLHMRQDTH